MLFSSVRKLFHFNPTCEMAVANSQTSYMPPAHLRQFEHDLAMLPCFFGGKNDFVLVLEVIDLSFIDYLYELNFDIPSFITSVNDFNISGKLDELSPWGWSPAVHKKLEPFLPFCDEKWLGYPMSRWKTEHALLLSRETNWKFAKQLIEQNIKDYELLEIPALPLKVKTLDEIESLIYKMPPPMLLKSPWSASGRGLFKIRDVNEHAETNAWVKSKLKQQGAFFAEPFLQKIQDVSFHFYATEDGIEFLGTTFFNTDSKGQFISCNIRYPENSILETVFMKEACNQASEFLKSGLEKFEINKYYRGAIGIDALFFHASDNKIKLHPCIEVNLRHTMGLLNLFIRKKIHPERNGRWSIVKLSAKEWNDINISNKHIMDDGFIAHGNIALTPPPERQNAFMVLLEMENFQ